MRLVYYTHPAFLEPALCLARELSRDLELHLLLEVSPGAWRTAAFDVAPRTLPPGLVPADPILREAFPPGVREYWTAAASCHLVVHPARRSLHPSSWRIGRQVLDFAAAHGDLLHLDDVDVSPRMPLVLRGWKAPLTIAVHDPEPHTGELRWRKRLARRLAYPRADGFVLYNAASRETFAARYGIAPGRIAATRLGPYDLFREWTAPPASMAGTEEPPLVLFFGRLSAYKGLDVFYDAARIVASRVPGARFVVAGPRVPGYVPPDPPRLAAPASIEVIDRYLSNAETADLFRRARLVVCPYRDATQSGVVLTAFAFRVPVVASAVGGLPEYVQPERTGVLVPAGDAVATAEAVCRVLDDEGLAARLRDGIAAATREELSWRRTAEDLRRIWGMSIAG